MFAALSAIHPRKPSPRGLGKMPNTRIVGKIPKSDDGISFMALNLRKILLLSISLIAPF